MREQDWFLKIALCTLACLLFSGSAIRVVSAGEAVVYDASSSSNRFSMPDRWLAQDKLEHLVVSAFFSGVTYSACRDFYNNNEESSLCFSASFTLGLGLCKEMYDKRKPQGRFSYKDLVADLVGVGLGLLIATR